MKNTFQLTLAGIEITVKRKRIKNMYLRVHPDGHVLLTAPMRMPNAMIERFASERLPWLMKQRAASTRQPDVRYETGNTIPVFGVPCRLTVLPGGKHARVDRLENEILLSMPENSTQEDRARALDGFLRKQLALAIETLIPDCEQIVGRHASVWKIRDMKTRWGTCNTASAAITINLQLARRDMLYLRYVMLHELTHLWEPAHDARFYTRMDQYCPDWKRIRKALKQGG